MIGDINHNGSIKSVVRPVRLWLGWPKQCFFGHFSPLLLFKNMLKYANISQKANVTRPTAEDTAENRKSQATAVAKF